MPLIFQLLQTFRFSGYFYFTNTRLDSFKRGALFFFVCVFFVFFFLRKEDVYPMNGDLGIFPRGFYIPKYLKNVVPCCSSSLYLEWGE